MFVIVRNSSGTTETLTYSGTDFDKTFTDRAEAEQLAESLNNHTDQAMHWIVEEKNMATNL